MVRRAAYMGSQYKVMVGWHGQGILLQVSVTRLQSNIGERYYLGIHLYSMPVLADAA